MKNRVLSSTTLFLSPIFAIALGGLVLRLAGHQPWAYRTIDADEPTTHEPDPLLGWRGMEGRYVIPAYSPEREDIRMTFLADGAPITRENFLVEVAA